ncbi:MAG: hypothetical protein RI995_2028 [Bacteroidota bacterium]
MKSKSWLLILIPVLAIIIYVSIPQNPTESKGNSSDSTAWVRWKKDKDESMKTGADSPILNKEAFNGLQYFSYNPNFVIKFNLKKAEKIQRIPIQMTDGTTEEVSYFGDIESVVAGQSIRLKLYQHDNGELFLPFKDKTAPQETYGGGRYLDIPISSLHDSGILINFNYAYNPFCAYNKNYACPVPPKENHLGIRVEAGEKLTPGF